MFVFSVCIEYFERSLHRPNISWHGGRAHEPASILGIGFFLAESRAPSFLLHIDREATLVRWATLAQMSKNEVVSNDLPTKSLTPKDMFYGFENS